MPDVHMFVFFSSPGYVRKQIPVSGYLCPALIREGVSSAASATP